MQLERELQLYLLARCSSLGNEDEKAILLWAIERLQWLSPWQADYLPQAHLEMLAARLLAQELQKSEAFLHAGEERAALDGLVALANSEWLQPFERRLQFQEGVLRLLERSEHCCLLYTSWSRPIQSLPGSRRWSSVGMSIGGR